MSTCIVVGVGGSGSGLEAARTAAKLADMMRIPIVLVFGYESVAMGPRGGALLEQVLEVGQDAVRDLQTELLAAHPELVIEHEFVQERPVDALVNVAAARNATMIAVGHGGAGPLRAALLGSITYEIVHRAPIPVLVVPDDKEAVE